MTKRLLAAVAVLVLAAMALHGAAHAAVLDADSSCAACSLGAARAKASEPPRVVRVEPPSVSAPPPTAPVERAAVLLVPFARPPPRG